MTGNAYLKRQVTGLILAGGLSHRMGCDKAFVTIGNQSMISYVAECLAPQVIHLMISANHNYSKYRLYGSVVEDQLKGHGPLGGILAALLCTKTPYLAVAPCDALFLPINLFQKLFQAMQSESCEVAYVLEQKKWGIFQASSIVFD